MKRWIAIVGSVCLVGCSGAKSDFEKICNAEKLSGASSEPDPAKKAHKTATWIDDNIGNPHEMTIVDMARLIIRMTGSRSKIVFKPLPTDDPKVRQPDITRARTLLRWEPKVSLEQGLGATIEYFKAKMKL